MTIEPGVTPQAVAALTDREIRRSSMARWLQRLGSLTGWAGFVAIWYVISGALVGSQQLPPPHAVISEAAEVLGETGAGSTVWASLSRVLAGCLIALFASAVFGVASTYSAWARRLVSNLMRVFSAIPIVALSALSLIFFGVSSAGPVVMAALVAAPFVTMSVSQGLYEVDRKLIVMSESFARTRSQIVTSVLLPSSVFAVIAGGRQAFALAWRVALLTEVFAAADGVGFQIRRSFESYDVRAMLAWTVIVLVVMLLFENLFFRQLERRAFGGVQLALSTERNA